MRTSGVVAADAFLRRPPDEQRGIEEVGVRPVGNEHDGMRAADDVELLVAPRGALGPFVLRIADLRRLPRERLLRVGGAEVELDHLPVALVRVPEVVEDVEEPVLQREAVGVAALGRDMRVDRRLPAGRDLTLPLLVAATWAEGIPGKVEVVLEEPATEPGRRRADRDQVGAAPRASQRDRVVAEDRVDVDRAVRLPRAARLLLRDELEHGREPQRQRTLCPERVGACATGARQAGEQTEREGEDDPPTHRFSAPGRRARARPPRAAT